MPLFTKLPSWASILITVIAAIIVVGLVSWGTYTLVKPSPEEPEVKGECENLWWYDNEHNYCQQKQFCGMYMYQGLKTFDTKEECEKSLTTEDQYKDWKTYNDSKYSFEIKYPQNWKLDKYTNGYNNEGPYVLVFTTGRTQIGSLPFISIRENWSINKEIERINNSGSPFTKVKSTKDINIGSIPAKQITYSTDIGLDFQKTIISQNQTAFMFDSYPGDTDFYQILSTFKFIDETADWKTYRNEEYGFEVKYPEDWTYIKVSENWIAFDGPGKEYSGPDAPSYDFNVKVIEATVSDLNQWAIQKAGGQEVITNSKNIIIDEVSGKRIEYSGFYPWYLAVGTIKGGDLYEFFTINNDIVSTFDQILSTFKFTK